MNTFLKALEDFYSLEPADRFMETSSIWQAIALDLARSVEVDPANMGKLSETYLAVLVEKSLLHPIPPRYVYQTLKNLLYAFIAKDSKSNRTFHSEFRQALADDAEYHFNLVSEKLIYKWQQVQFQYDFRNDKRALSPADLPRDIRRLRAASRPKRHRWPPRSASTARAAASAITCDRIVPPGSG